MKRPRWITEPTLRRILAVLASLTAIACSSGQAILPEDRPNSPVRHLVPRIIATHPHDQTAFTQGLEIVSKRLFETTGRYGSSGLREVDRNTGRVVREAILDDAWFGEGFTALDNERGLQLTWKAGRALVWDLDTLTIESTLSYGGQGWGLCRLDNGLLAMSDGSDQLIFRDSETMRRINSVDVRLDGEPVERLNELECVGPTVWANVWLTDRIVGIDVASGRVSDVVDASGLVADRSGFDPEDVLNGIAYDHDSERFLLTGKRWPVLYEVEFVANS